MCYQLQEVVAQSSSWISRSDCKAHLLLECFDGCWGCRGHTAGGSCCLASNFADCSGCGSIIYHLDHAAAPS